MKAFLNISKLIMYLYLYIHFVACGLWMAVSAHAPEQFIRDINRGGYYSARNGSQLNVTGT